MHGSTTWKQFKQLLEVLIDQSIEFTSQIVPKQVSSSTNIHIKEHFPSKRETNKLMYHPKECIPLLTPFFLSVLPEMNPSPTSSACRLWTLYLTPFHAPKPAHNHRLVTILLSSFYACLPQHTLSPPLSATEHKLVTKKANRKHLKKVNPKIPAVA